MTLAIILIVFAVIALALILFTVISPRFAITRRSGAAEQIRPIDLEAFRNLTDPAEEEYLRRRLPQAQFRRAQRARFSAMAAYMSQASKNAAVLARVGEAALAAGDPASREAAMQLINDAVLLRRNATFALLKIYTVYPWPSSGRGAVPVVAGYERLSGSAMLLGRLQNRTTAVRIAST